MCKKNDYGRKAITVLLALLTALFALALMSGSANAASLKAIPPPRAQIISGVLANHPVNFYNIVIRL